MKRFLDFAVSLIWLVLFWWVLAILALCVKLEDGGSVLFKQRRIGINKREFYIYKFRTMRADTPKDVPTHLLQNPDSYITKIGHFLRRSSLDELPQIINIIKGDMSFVGPRPALYNQYDLIKARDEVNANSVYPGLTGWAQVNGRDELPITVKAAFDGEYVKKMSFWFDVKIIFKTVVSVFKADGVVEGVQETEKLKGEKSRDESNNHG
jgi:O-antigen biosynthesis protein WbqP